MAAKSNLVNLDAMIKRSDFSILNDEETSHEKVNSIGSRDLMANSPMSLLLRKPDFQRETNHWTPEQVVSLLECYINGDLIPSVILWKSPTHLFVIDGGHRLSVIRAWIEDDYGDGPISHQLFGHEISHEQRRAAKRTRELVNSRVKPWSYYSNTSGEKSFTPDELRKVSIVASRALPVQWVDGNVDKAEKSFFNINSKGTPLDDIEEKLLKYRKNPIAISSRSIIRAGKGHKYWSKFDATIQQKIEEKSKKIHHILFDPEINRPIKTLDLPLGGAKGIRAALQILMDVLIICDGSAQKPANSIEKYTDDEDGSETLRVLQACLGVVSRITGNDNGSVGLHPAIYFYSVSGRHSIPMFLGTVSLFAKKIANNDSEYFFKFIKVRQALEALLVEKKELISLISQKHISKYRVIRYAEFLERIISELHLPKEISEEDLIRISNLEGKIISGSFSSPASTFSDDTKSQVFIERALQSSEKCPICNGYIDFTKSLSYDHITRKEDGGTGSGKNCQITHPFCNQSVKERNVQHPISSVA